MRCPIFRNWYSKEFYQFLHENPGFMGCVFINGCFDLFHAGHLAVFDKALSSPKRPIVVAVNGDAAITRAKGSHRPCLPWEDRAIIPAYLGVDLVVGFEEDTPLELMQVLQVAEVIKGDDYCEEDIVAPAGCIKTIVPKSRDLSTTKLIDRIVTQHVVYIAK